jgi:hypothetical protein
VPNPTTSAMREDPGTAFSPTLRPAAKLAVLVPTRNEAANIEELLLELLVRSRGLRTTEVGFAFADRHAGDSKGSFREGVTYVGSLGDLRLGRRTPSPPRSVGAEVELLAPLARHTGTMGA